MLKSTLETTHFSSSIGVSPCSAAQVQIKSRSRKQSEADLNDSILNNGDFEHPLVTWNSYLQFQKNCLGEKPQKISKQNAVEIINSIYNTQNQQKMSLEQQIKANDLLSLYQKKQFVSDLRAEKYFTKFLMQLRQLSEDLLFRELVFVSFLSWQMFLSFQNKFLIAEPLLPKFHQKHDLFMSEQGTDNSHSQDLIKIPLESLLQEAQRVAIEITEIILINPKVSIITLRNQSMSVPICEAKRMLEDFVTVLSKATFLCVEGYFQHPNHKESDFWQLNYFQNQTAGILTQEDMNGQKNTSLEIIIEE